MHWSVMIDDAPVDPCEDSSRWIPGVGTHQSMGPRHPTVSAPVDPPDTHALEPRGLALGGRRGSSHPARVSAPEPVTLSFCPMPSTVHVPLHP